MTINDAIYSYLSGYAGLTALIGTRIYPLVLSREATHPAIAWQRIDTPREYSHDGYSHLAHPRFQFACYAASRAAAKAVADQVRLALQGYTGTMGGADGVDVQAAFVEDEREDYESDTKLFRADVDVTIWHQET